MKEKINEPYIPFIDSSNTQKGEREFFFNLALELCIKKRGTYILSLSELPGLFI